MSEAIEFYNNAKKNKQDERAILITDELTIADSSGLGMVTGLMTKASGIASHAAVMARANGIPCVVGYKGLEVDPESNSMMVNGKRYPAGTLMTMEAASEGRMYLGKGELQNLSFQEGVVKSVTKLIGRVVASENIPLSVYSNINNAKDAQNGLNFGADGVGLCRTENMFIRPEAMWEIRNIIFTQNPKETSESFQKLETQQFEDYLNIFKVMQDRTVNIRLMDMPLAELVPQSDAEFSELFGKLKHLDETFIRGVAEGMREHNPMLGLRACRFGMVMPEIYQMQIRAIVRAAYEVQQSGGNVNPGIMFPLVFAKPELQQFKKMVLEIEEQVRDEFKSSG